MHCNVAHRKGDMCQYDSVYRLFQVCSMKMVCWYIHMRASQMETSKVQRRRDGGRGMKKGEKGMIESKGKSIQNEVKRIWKRKKKKKRGFYCALVKANETISNG